MYQSRRQCSRRGGQGRFSGCLPCLIQRSWWLLHERRFFLTSSSSPFLLPALRAYTAVPFSLPNDPLPQCLFLCLTMQLDPFLLPSVVFGVRALSRGSGPAFQLHSAPSLNTCRDRFPRECVYLDDGKDELKQRGEQDEVVSPKNHIKADTVDPADKAGTHRGSAQQERRARVPKVRLNSMVEREGVKAGRTSVQTPATCTGLQQISS